MEQIYDPSPDEAVYQSVRAALETARTKAAAAINDAMVSFIIFHFFKLFNTNVFYNSFSYII